MIKKGKIWHDDRVVMGQRFQFSTGQTNIVKARLASNAFVTNKRLELMGVVMETSPAVSPLFKAFMTGRFLDYVRRHARAKGTIDFYANRTNALIRYPPFAQARLTDINDDMIEEYKEWRGKQPKKNGRGPIANSSINRELTTLRKALGLASKWDLIGKVPKPTHLPAKNARDFYVLTGEMENLYLAKVEYPLKELAILMLDLGLRPAECVALDKRSDISATEIFVRQSKTAKGVRALPLTARAHEVIQRLSAMWPDSQWLFPSTKKKGAHMTRGSFDHVHEAKQQELDLPKEFVLYSLRHTFGTRLAESGASPFEIKEAMGHEDIRVSQKYIHLSSSHLTMALKRKEMYDQMLRNETVKAGDPGVPAKVTVAKKAIS